ncbi:type I-F CRISPR-associated helicase Cas3 [Pseudoalteromonas sp. A25]|uniref:type I-F CRISPR-associated helicase Cas3f n=1 Tax=Pseudoalteromonas sp. A25 TaxID=116092 RepID=UPI001260BBBA|nr:type I-F CRISPR-associated helicase Cas3f [Pseudoalteromonas sp. A25]BBN83871.1 type I-F CRISPR-associated helicase Cas3 [Pseudoalteromonas sp. A25]
MMVTFVSQCEKNALKKTRRVLDAFANRIGDNTWQTLITEDGLLTVKKMLRKTASRSTAVSCHWIRSRSRSQLLWVVGNRNKFNLEGVVPVNWTRRNLLNSEIESDWHFLPLIKGLVGIAALLHDWGKATELFQSKLQPNNPNQFKGDPIRHEWISLLLLRGFIDSTSEHSDKAWLQALSRGDINEQKVQAAIKQSPLRPMAQLPPIAKLVAWLVVSHHRLPLPKQGSPDDYKSETAKSLDDMLAKITQQWGYENSYNKQEFEKRLGQCFEFPNGLMSNSKPWLSRVKRWSSSLLDYQALAIKAIETGGYRVLVHHARLCLMLGDHYYSSQQADKKWQNTTGLFANTDRATKQLKQKLDEHLVGVARYATQAAHLLPAFESELPQATDIESLRKPSPKDYKWQDKAVAQISQWRALQAEKEHKRFGFFALNMASTGCGKTFANAKVMRALSDDSKSLRYILALGLRTLTLQTGDEYAQRVGLDNTQLAVVIGSKAVMELHKKHKTAAHTSHFEQTGSESEAPLLDEDVDFECDIPQENLTTVLNSERDKKFLYAPVLACTIDHIISAIETTRGGKYILPSLRLMSSDLVIDEVDDFTDGDLIAIGRLIHLAGMLGRKVMLSSATIPPSLAEGYFKAYRDGWQLYCATRSASEHIGCAWIDEFNTHLDTNRASSLECAILQYRAKHDEFIQKRQGKLAQQPILRKADISLCEAIYDKKQVPALQVEGEQTKQSAYFSVIAKSILAKHDDHHFVDENTKLNVSFGVVRVANIKPCVALAQFLLSYDWPDDIAVRVMPYHSQQTLLLRSIQEQHLDQVLKRKESANEQPKALQNTLIREHLNKLSSQQNQVKNLIFVLVATPVEEVGRDHDFDWAVIEPSSYRSIIQLAGRVRRHRKTAVESPNVALLQYNYKAIKNAHVDGLKAFVSPGFEKSCRLKSHDLTLLIDIKQIAERLDASARICKPKHINVGYVENLTQAQSLAELEHVVTLHALAYYKSTSSGARGPGTLQGYLEHHWFLTALPQALTPFRKGAPNVKTYLVFDQYQQRSRFCEKDPQGRAIDREEILNIKRIALSAHQLQRLWLVRDFDQACAELADCHAHEQSPLTQRVISLKYGELSFPFNENKRYAYNDQLGLVKVE